jgi:glycosyltransferase involved in cell wall biosynthesis
MACGIPVAATDVGDVRAIAGGTGEVVPPKNPEALCAAWQRLRARRAREPALGEAARGAIVSNYGLEIMVRRTEEVLAQVAAERPAQEIAREFA